MNKKILWILLLIIFMIAIIIIAIFVKPRDTSNDDKIDISKRETNIEMQNQENEQSKTSYQKVILNDGILYSSSGKLERADIVVGTNYFDTVINDMYLNADNYQGKLIEIEGMYLESGEYTFVGRYSTANTCAFCADGFSNMEYQLEGDIDEELTDTESWIKVIGTLEKGKAYYGTSEDSYYYYYYIKVINLEIMNERGQDTVTN